MIRLRRATVLDVIEDRPGARELSVQVDGERSPSRAVAYTDLVGPVEVRDRVVVNTTAVALRLGTGGLHFVVAVDRADEPTFAPTGRTMKLRYTPHQVNVLAVEEEGSPHRARMEQAVGLDGAPVVWLPLHSMVAPAAAGARAAGARRVVYVMTGGAALPAPLTRVVASLRRSGVLESVITAGQAFGGDLEAVSTFSALLAARHVTRADVVLVGDGPVNTGTGTTWGATDVESAMALNATAIVEGQPVAALRISFADRRERHRGLSHHSVTALGKVALVPVHVAVPVLEEDGQRRLVWAALRDAGIDERHQLVEVNGQPALDFLAEQRVAPESMGRKVADDPAFFLAAGAAGILAGRMAAEDRRWDES
ncbi:MAG TPA: DUF3866 family protein [Actinomycetota bacterium]|nr:DUF3866 family protein [Actinomycetota bacterium]